MISLEEMEANWRIAQQEVAAQFKRAERLEQDMRGVRVLLERIEWKATDDYGHYCVECFGDDGPYGKDRKHRPGCELAALLTPK